MQHVRNCPSYRIISTVTSGVSAITTGDASVTNTPAVTATATAVEVSNNDNLFFCATDVHKIKQNKLHIESLKVDTMTAVDKINERLSASLIKQTPVYKVLFK